MRTYNMTKTIISTIAAIVISTSAFAADVQEWVNPKGNTVVQIAFDNGDILKYRPISGTYRFQPIDAPGNYELMDDLFSIDDYIMENEGEVDGIIEQIEDLGDFDNIVDDILDVL